MSGYFVSGIAQGLQFGMQHELSKNNAKLLERQTKLQEDKFASEQEAKPLETKIKKAELEKLLQGIQKTKAEIGLINEKINNEGLNENELRQLQVTHGQAISNPNLDVQIRRLALLLGGQVHVESMKNEWGSTIGTKSFLTVPDPNNPNRLIRYSNSESDMEKLYAELNLQIAQRLGVPPEELEKNLNTEVLDPSGNKIEQKNWLTNIIGWFDKKQDNKESLLLNQFGTEDISKLLDEF